MWAGIFSLLLHNFKLLSFLRSFISLQILMNDWLPRCADLVDSMMDHWKHLVPMKSKDGGRAAILFRCIHSLMSRQVQGLIKRSIDHFFKALAAYKVYMPTTSVKKFCSHISIYFPFSLFNEEILPHLNALWAFFRFLLFEKKNSNLPFINRVENDLFDFVAVVWWKID